ncbi:uncharacterized protein [Penaeus vannamei]|uniref:uncharacterized protein n=1 Tax=Penaeus vannamei TaxID=6689 RepID=UPI00387F7214
MKLVLYLLVVATSIRLGGCGGVTGLQVTLEVAFPHQHRFHLTWEGEQNSLYKVCVAGWSHDCVDVPGPEYTVEEDLPSGSVFTFFVMDAAEPDDFSSFVSVFYPSERTGPDVSYVTVYYPCQSPMSLYTIRVRLLCHCIYLCQSLMSPYTIRVTLYPILSQAPVKGNDIF